MKSRFEDNYCIGEYYNYCESQVAAGLIPSSFDTWLEQELDKERTA